jgi:hypothetical protein
MHVGPDPTEYGLAVSGSGCSLPPVVESMLNAEIELFEFVVFVVDLLST